MSSIPTLAGEAQELKMTPAFWGLVRGELFKIRQMTSIKIYLILTLCLLVAVNILTILSLQMSPQENAASLLQNFDMLTVANLLVLRIFIGFFLIILTANVIGREYQLGTVRILLARGIGRVQLLLAKVSAVVIVALFTLLMALLIFAIFIPLTPLIKLHNFNALHVLTGAFWYSMWLYLLTIIVSMGLTILMTVAMGAIGRSMSVGLTLAMVWFPADNIAVLVIFIIGALVHNPNLIHISEYLLGPNLNQMPVAIVPSNPYNANITPGPQIAVDGTHTLLIALGYAVIFATIAIILTGKRDVKE